MSGKCGQPGVPCDGPFKGGEKKRPQRSESSRGGGRSTYLTSAQVNAKARDAIVDVEGVTILQAVPVINARLDQGTTVVTTPISIDTSGGLPDFVDAAQVYRVAGSGFFTDCRYIVTSASLVTLPALIPANLSGLSGVNQGDDTPVDFALVRDPLPQLNSDGQPIAPLVRANRIYVRVYNVNGCGCSYLYEAVLVGVDGAANTAVLRIDETLIFNKDKPCLDKAVFLKWGKSCKYPIGSDAYNISNSNQTTRKFSGGYVRDNADKDVRFKYYESVDTDIPFFSGQVGSPILDSNGNVIAIATGRTGDINNDQVTQHTDPEGPGFDGLTDTEALAPQESLGNDYGQPGSVADPTQQNLGGTVIVPNINLFAAGIGPGPIPVALINVQNDLNRIKGSLQDIKGTLFGVAQHIAKRIVRSFVKADQGKCTKRVEIQQDVAGPFFRYRKGWFNAHVELVTTNTWLNHNIEITGTDSPEDSIAPTVNFRIPYCSEVTGYYVRCINPDSVLLAAGVSPCDVITEIACQKLGECGVGFYSILWKFKPGDTVRITYYRESDNYATAQCAMIRLEEIFFDWPLEALNVFSLFNPQVAFGYDQTPLCGPIATILTDVDPTAGEFFVPTGVGMPVFNDAGALVGFEPAGYVGGGGLGNPGDPCPEPADTDA